MFLSFLPVLYAATISASPTNRQRIQSLIHRKAELIAELKMVEDRLHINQERPHTNQERQNWRLGKAALVSNEHAATSHVRKCDFGASGHHDKLGTASCGPWAASGECTNNPSWMMENCERSCLVPALKVAADKDDNCPSWAQAGNCETNPWMCDHCATSCYKVSWPENDMEEECADTPGWKNPYGFDCKAYMDKKWCSNRSPAPGGNGRWAPNSNFQKKIVLHVARIALRSASRAL